MPFTKLFKSNPESELHWAADMALRLLQEKQACESSHQHRQQDRSSKHDNVTSPASYSTSANASDSSPSLHWCPWVASLPQDALTPLGFSDAAVAALGDPGVVAEVQGMRQYFQSYWAALTGPEHGPQAPAVCGTYEQFMWAVQVFTSRCFFEPSLGCHLAVPGVDMANHSFQPNASVQVRHGVDTCQGRDAVEDVCDPSAAGRDAVEDVSSASPSVFQLVAGPDGIEEGEEVTICYGSTWPNEPYLLLFGFVPEDNPSDGVILFPNLVDLARALIQDQQQGQQSGIAKLSEEQVEELLETVFSQPEVLAAAESGDWDRLQVSRAGIDPRLGPAYELVRQGAETAGCSGLLDLQQLLRAECEEMLGALQQAAAAAESGLCNAVGADTAARFRQQKQLILQQVLAGLD